MKKIYRCRVCGYLTTKEDPPEVCPACGVKGKIFEEFDSPISKKRRRMLDLHIHPASVHFPIAFVTSMVLLSFLRVVGVFGEHSVFSGMLRAIVFILPFAAIFATTAGMYDGRLRFKKINTPHLKRKLVLAGLFIFVSASLFVIQYVLDLNSSTLNLIVLIFSIVLLGLAAPLGLIGGKLLDAKVRG
jgi:uncharacterized membrane protein/rubredoxin